MPCVCVCVYAGAYEPPKMSQASEDKPWFSVQLCGKNYLVKMVPTTCMCAKAGMEEKKTNSAAHMLLVYVTHNFNPKWENSALFIVSK